jgi:hypothetical protein
MNKQQHRIRTIITPDPNRLRKTAERHPFVARDGTTRVGRASFKSCAADERSERQHENSCVRQNRTGLHAVLRSVPFSLRQFATI